MRHLILNNLGLKVISLGLAVLIWLAIKMSLLRDPSSPPSLFRRPATEEYRCPVLVLHSSTNAQAFEVQPSEVLVRVSGDRAVMRHVEKSDLQAFVVLLDLCPFPSVFPVDVKLPHDVGLVDVDPKQVTVIPLGPD